MPFESISHQSHQDWHNKLYPDEASRQKIVQSWQEMLNGHSINRWIHRRMLDLALPVIAPNEQWLTVGDAYGMDGAYLVQKGCEVTATDISGTFLPLAQAEGYIQHYAIENVERLSFADNSFDYVLCKESYHHFPRPYLAVYEMLRVARKGVLLIEPQDPVARMPLLLALRNIMDRFDPNLLSKYWKNRYSFEEVGNYVFKLSEREMEKLAMGLNLPAVAFKGLNNNYYHPSTADQPAAESSATFQKIQRRLRFDDTLAWLGLKPHHLLGALIFKQLPDEMVLQNLKKSAFTYYQFPKNPYL